MAVSFKIPKSPKRDIFVIDNFQGVDFTNIGADVDPTRSPNAPNMNRHVPGKVRKRMGYEKYVLFSNVSNVNWARGTSSKETDIVVSPSLVGQSIPLYDLMKEITETSDFTIYLDFDYFSTDDFTILDDLVIPASEEWTHYQGTKTYAANSTLYTVSLVSATQQNIGIKEFSLMRFRNASYKWSPAPRYYYNTFKNYVYGCHLYKTREPGGNKVVNVNRALNTSSSYITLNLTDTNQDVYTLGEYFYRNEDETVRRSVRFSFDYTLTGTSNVLVVIAGWQLTNGIAPTSTEKHVVLSNLCGSYTNNKVRFRCKDAGATATLKIKNFAVCYSMDEDFEWSKAPEDTGGTFPVNEIYFDSNRNYAEINNFSADITSEADEDVVRNYSIFTDILSQAYEDSRGFVHLSFDLYAYTSSAALTGIEVRIVEARSASDNGYNVEIITETGNIINKHYDLYVNSTTSTRAVNAIGVRFIFASAAAGRECSIRLSNIDLRVVTPRNTFNNNPEDKLVDIYHVGDSAYLRAHEGEDISLIGTDINMRRSWSQQMDDTLAFLDGKDIYSYKFGQASLAPISSDEAYIPLVTISRAPTGGGVSYESLNLLQPGFYEQFYVNSSSASATSFHLSFGTLDATRVRAWVLNSSGNWVSKTEGTHFSVNRTTGVVTFTSAPGASPISGEDNVKILAYRTVEGYRDKIAKCTFGTLFGVGGESDRLFVSGNPDFPNQDFYSGRNDITYFPDTGYSALGSSSGEIVGYARVNNYLATFINGANNTQSVYIREGDLVTKKVTALTGEVELTDPAFKIINALQGVAAISPYTFGYLQTEPVFLTKSGVFAITPQDITGEKYGQNRSFYINEQLRAEDRLEDAMSVVYKDMYILSLNGKLYVLDGLQPVRTDKGEPYATRQYSAFYCDNIPATCVWTDDEALWFGTADGKICRFYTNVSDLNSYNDDGQIIDAWWETPDLDGALFYKNKTFRYFAIRMMRAMRTSCELWSRKMSNWTFIKDDTSSGVVFDFGNIDFENFSFSTDTSEKIVHTKLRIKKVDKARFKIRNAKLNEPFGLFDLALEYVESGNYKR